MNQQQLAIIDRTGHLKDKQSNELERRLQANISPIRRDRKEPDKEFLRQRLNISPNSPRKNNNNDDLQNLAS